MMLNKLLLGFVLGALLLAFSFPAGGQRAGKVPRLGFLAVSRLPYHEGFRQGLRELGYAEGKNLHIDYRYAEGKIERLPGLAAELVRLKVDVIVSAGGTPVIMAAKNATNAIPITFVGSADPVALGIVASLARPGGNVTGLNIGAPELYGKRLELLKEAVPGTARAALLLNPDNPAAHLVLKETQISAQALGLQIQSLEVRGLNDFEGAFDAAIKGRVGALIVAQNPPITTHPKRVVELAAKHRLPAMYAVGEYVADGGLMAYGPSMPDLYRRAAAYVDKILKGAKPADLPVEQPTKFELVINLKTAKQLGLTIPPEVLMRADKVIK
jgi:putative tryptophan/tyrosine transport system substrate-binding protein